MGAILSNDFSGRSLRALRKARGIKQNTLAELLEIDQATVSRWELGNSTPGPAALERLSAVFPEIDPSPTSAVVMRRYDFDSRWGVLIRHYRATRFLTQQALAEILRTDVTTVGRWERGLFQPDLARQKQLRDLILKPLDKSSQFKVLSERMRRSPAMISIAYGPIMLIRSKGLVGLHLLNQIHAGSCVDQMYNGKLRRWYNVRHETGFYQGEVPMTTAVNRLSDNDARLQVAYPIRLEDDTLLTLVVHHQCASSDTAADGTFRIYHSDELVG